MNNFDNKNRPEGDKVPSGLVEVREASWGIGAKDLNDLDQILYEIIGTPEPEFVLKTRGDHIHNPEIINKLIGDKARRRHEFEPYDKMSIIIYDLKEHGYLMNFAVGYHPHFEKESADKLGLAMGLALCNITINSAIIGVKDFNKIAERLNSTGLLRHAVDGSDLSELFIKSEVAVDDFTQDEEVVFTEKYGSDLEIEMWVEDDNSKFGFQVRGAKNGYIKLPVIDEGIKNKMRTYAAIIAQAFDTNINLEEEK